MKSDVVRAHIPNTRGDMAFDIVTYAILSAVVLLMVYPLYFVLIASVSDPMYVNSGAFLLYPKGFTTLGYRRVFADQRIITGYMNTLLYASCGTLLGLFATTMAGYSLSRVDLPGRSLILKLMVFTMYFGGGMIPFYILVKGLGLVNTRLLMVILGSISVYNIIITRSFFSNTIPMELQDAAFVDGCSNQRFFFTIVLPLAKPILAVIALYLAVGYWNAYFNPMIFLTDIRKYPLQLYLREILLTAKTNESSVGLDAEAALKLETMVEVVKYGVIVVSTLPIICVYPFLQKYFIKGVMIGSIKG